MSIESARFEGYGPDGAAVIVDCQTDNRTQTVAELRHVFKMFGGNLGAPGSVAYLFKPVGRMIYPRGTDLQALAAMAYGAGVEDIVMTADGVLQAFTDPVELEAVRAQLSSVGFTPLACDVTERAAVPVPLSGAAAVAMRALLLRLSELNGVRGVYSNGEISDEFVAQL